MGVVSVCVVCESVFVCLCVWCVCVECGVCVFVCMLCVCLFVQAYISKYRVSKTTNKAIKQCSFTS